MEAIHTTHLGRLYNADCMDLLASVEAGSVDCVFADPPFNLSKDYGPRAPDNMTENDYLEWSRRWLDLSIETLSPGGSIFAYNIPKWSVHIASHLMARGLMFRHWIAIEHKSTMPIQGRLYPAHYSLLYFTKGKPRHFAKVRTPIETCRHCDCEIKDYGGHRSAMHPDGVNLKDVWTDIPPVRHRKFKPGARSANALSTKVVERVLNISTLSGDMVLDPFGGSGTTYAVCERMERQWIGCEVEDCASIIDRLNGEAEPHRNDDVVSALAT